MADRGDDEGWPWPAPSDDGRAGHLAPGHEWPDVALDTTAGRPFSLSRIRGLLVVFIYPWAGRPGHPNPPRWDEIAGAHGSTPELQGVATLYTAFYRLRATVVAISGQTPTDQLELKQRLGLPFELASDREGLLRDALGLPTFETGGVRYLSRLTLTAHDGRIERVFYPVHPPHTHPRAVLAATAAALPIDRTSG
jgi:peroxiredoxin